MTLRKADDSTLRGNDALRDLLNSLPAGWIFKRKCFGTEPSMPGNGVRRDERVTLNPELLYVICTAAHVGRTD